MPRVRQDRSFCPRCTRSGRPLLQPVGVCWTCLIEMARECPPVRTGRLRKYDLDHNEYGRLYARQAGRCAICRSGNALVIDHDHDTGQVRGLLCSHCNSALGFFRDNSDSLRRAITYLGQAKAKNQTPPKKEDRHPERFAATRPDQGTDALAG